MMSQNMAGDVSVIVQNGASIKERNISVESLNHLYMDTSFSGSPAQCDPETCEIMRNTLNFRPTIGLEESNQVRNGGRWHLEYCKLTRARRSTSTYLTWTAMAGLAASTVSCRPARLCSSRLHSQSEYECHRARACHG